jgi:hypothetical protein
VVVSSDNAAQSFALADRKGQLYEIHPDGTTPKVGSTVSLATHKLANGTLEASRSVTSKAAAKASALVSGTVSYLDQTKKRYYLSGGGVSLPVVPSTTIPPPLPASGRQLKLQLALPAPSASAATVALGLLEQTRTDSGAAKPPLELAGVVTAVDAVARKVTLSADSGNTSGDTIVLSVPAAINLKPLVAQEAVVAHATIGTDGSYTLTGADADTGVSAADDPTNQLGDFVPTKHATRRSKAARLARVAPPPLTLFGLTAGLSG